MNALDRQPVNVENDNCCDGLWSILKSVIPQVSVGLPLLHDKFSYDMESATCSMCNTTVAAAIFTGEYALYTPCNHVRECRLTTAEQRCKKSR